MRALRGIQIPYLRKLNYKSYNFMGLKPQLGGYPVQVRIVGDIKAL